MPTFPRPQPGDYAPYFDRYLALVPGTDDLIALLSDQGEALTAHLADVSEDRAGFRYADGKWSARQVVGHITDTERVFLHRAFCIARGDAQPLPPMDENAYMDGATFDERTLADLVDEFADVRRGSVRFLSTLTDEAAARAGTVNGYRATATAWAYLLYGHAAHHAAILRDRYGIG